MKLLDLTCPNCGSKLSYNKETGECTCTSCGGKFLLDDDSDKKQIEINNAKEAGYEFEKGRQKAQAEARRNNAQPYSNVTYRSKAPAKNNNLKWWVLGWIFFFPIPLTILVYRSKSLSQTVKTIILSVLWGYVAIVVLISSCNKQNRNYSETEQMTNESVVVTEISNNISSISDMVVGDSIELHKYESYTDHWFSINTTDGTHYSEEDVTFVSDDPTVATISLDHMSSNYVYYTVSAVSEGETDVYISLLDGSVESNHIHVIVNPVVEIESMSIVSESEVIAVGETCSLALEFFPEDGVNGGIEWSSSDSNIATVSDGGIISGISAGEVTISAVSSNGTSTETLITVDDTMRSFEVTVSRDRVDSNNIGGDWIYTYSVDDVAISTNYRITTTYNLRVGDVIVLTATCRESDDNPDVGETSINHTITEDDWNNGFSQAVDVYVTENGGRNSGQTAHFVITFTFESRAS